LRRQIGFPGCRFGCERQPHYRSKRDETIPKTRALDGQKPITAERILDLGAVAMTIGFLASITASTLEPDEPTLEQKVVFVIGAALVVIVLLLIAQVWLYLSREVPEMPSSDHGVRVFQAPIHCEDVDVAARQSPSQYL